MLGENSRAGGLPWRKCLLYAAALASAAGWYGQSVMRQRRAVDAILAAGGQVTYDLGRGDAEGATGLRKPIGVHRGDSHAWLDLYKTPTDVQLTRCLRADALCELLAQLEELRFVKLDGSDVTDAGLAKLATLQKLQALSLCGTDVSDAGMKHVARMKELWQLMLTRTRVTDRGATRLGVLRKLRWLGLENTFVTEAGVEQLQTAAPQCGAIAYSQQRFEQPGAGLELLAVDDETRSSPASQDAGQNLPKLSARVAFE